MPNYPELTKERALSLCDAFICRQEPYRSEAYTELYNSVSSLIGIYSHKYAFASLGITPEDLVSDFQLELITQIIPKYNPEKGSFGALCNLVFRRVAINNIRAKKIACRDPSRELRLDAPNSEGITHAEILEDPTPDPALKIEEREEFDRIIKGLSKHLSPLEQEILRLRALHLSLPEIAEIIGHRKEFRRYTPEQLLKVIDNATERIKHRYVELHGQPRLTPFNEEQYKKEYNFRTLPYRKEELKDNYQRRKRSTEEKREINNARAREKYRILHPKKPRKNASKLNTPEKLRAYDRKRYREKHPKDLRELTPMSSAEIKKKEIAKIKKNEYLKEYRKTHYKPHPRTSKLSKREVRDRNIESTKRWRKLHPNYDRERYRKRKGKRI